MYWGEALRVTVTICSGHSGPKQGYRDSDSEDKQHDNLL